MDQVQKLRDYLTIPSLQTYIMAETDSPLLTVHRREGGTFRREIIGGMDATLKLPEVGVEIPFTGLYQDIF